jgi:hypothetical protein
MAQAVLSPRDIDIDVHFSDTSLRQFGRTLLYIGIFGCVAILAISGKNVVPVSMMIAFYIAMIIAVRNSLWRRTPWPLPQPVLILSLWWLFSFGISSLPKFFGTSPIHWDLINHESYLYWALFLVMVSNAFVVVGYLAVWPNKVSWDRLHPQRLEGSLSYLMVIVFWVLSVVARIYLFGIGRFGYTADFSRPESGFRQAFTYVYEFAWLAIAALVVELVTTRDPAKRIKAMGLLGFISVMEMISVIVMGFKGYAVLTFAPAIAAVWGMRRRLPYKALLVGAVIVILITPGNYAYREDINKGRVERGNFLNAAEASIAYTVRGVASDPIESVVHVWESVTAEFADFLENTALILYKTPSRVPHRGSEWYFTAVPRALFPRFVWKDKPVDDMATYMTVVYRGVAATTGTPPGFTGELYMRAGVGGVVAGSFITGVLLGLVTRVFGRGRHKFTFVAASAVMAASISNTHLDSLIVYLVHRSIIYTAAAWLMYFAVRGRDETPIVKAGA